MSAMADLYNDMEAAQTLMGEGNKMNDFQADRLLKVAGNISESLAIIATCLECLKHDSLSQKDKPFCQLQSLPLLQQVCSHVLML